MRADYLLEPSSGAKRHSAGAAGKPGGGAERRNGKCGRCSFIDEGWQTAIFGTLDCGLGLWPGGLSLRASVKLLIVWGRIVDRCGEIGRLLLFTCLGAMCMAEYPAEFCLSWTMV